MKTPFDSDAQIVGGNVDIADSLVPPPEYGKFGLRWPYESMEAYHKLRTVRCLLWSCFDLRVVRPLYDHVLVRGYQPEEIFVISIGGGPLQVGAERTSIVEATLFELEGRLPNLEKVWAVAHTGVCRGLAHFCGGRPIGTALKPEYKAQASARNLDPELYATQLLLPGTYSLLPEGWHRITELSVCEPQEATQSVKLYSQWFTREDAKTTADLLA